MSKKNKSAKVEDVGNERVPLADVKDPAGLIRKLSDDISKERVPFVAVFFVGDEAIVSSNIGEESVGTATLIAAEQMMKYGFDRASTAG